MAREVEIKVRVDDVAAFARRVETAGGELVRPRTLEDDVLLDLPGGALARGGRLLRVRTAGGRGLVTAKVPAAERAGEKRLKVRRETEAAVEDPAAVRAVLERAGFVVRWRYQKLRRVWRLGDATVTLDEIPHGAWAEIEADPASIEAVAAALGLPREQWSDASYREIHERECARLGVPVGDMVFPGADA